MSYKNQVAEVFKSFVTRVAHRPYDADRLEQVVGLIRNDEHEVGIGEFVGGYSKLYINEKSAWVHCRVPEQGDVKGRCEQLQEMLYTIKIEE